MPRETRYAVAVIVCAYGIIASLAFIARDSWLLWIICLPIIGGLQNHLLLLHHEGAHSLIHSRRAVNDFITNLFCGYPFFELLRPYREFHFSHHRHATDESLDPEIPFYNQQGIFFTPLSKKKKFWHAVLDLSGYHWLQFFFSFLFSIHRDARLFSRHDRLSLLVFLLLLPVIFLPGVFATILWYWFVPQMTLTFYFAKQRGIREHGKRMAPISVCTNNLSANILERFFLFPLNSDQHLTHHLNPHLPWFEYPKWKIENSKELKVMRQKIFLSTFLLLICLGITSKSSWAQGTHHHPKHNMVLFGESEVFASHIVYKVPHNYQVILAMYLGAEDKERYIAAKKEHPTEQFIFLLDEMDIKDIATQPFVSGPVFYTDNADVKHEVIPSLRLTKENFKVIYFDELPLSLSGSNE